MSSPKNDNHLPAVEDDDHMAKECRGIRRRRRRRRRRIRKRRRKEEDDEKGIDVFC